MRPPLPTRFTMGFCYRETIMYRYLPRFAAMLVAVPLLLGGCKDNADPVKPKVAPPAAAVPVA